jgi:hypothetical protein
MPTGDELKKLRKREQRALERLQEAQKAQARALERFQRAEARLQKRSARLQRVEGRLVLLRQQLEQIPAQREPQSSEAQPLPYTPPDTNSYRVGAGLAPALEIQADIPHAGGPSTSPDKPALREDAEQLVNEARAVAEAAEENARLAAERASEIAARLDQVGSARHFAQELSELQAEAEQASLIAEEAARAADEADSLVADAEQLLDEIAEIPQQAEPFATPEEIVSIEEEEELTAALTAGTIAHITAERAAKAEVIAEISSKQTREAHRHAQDAEQALVEVRAAISSGALSGEEAQEALWRAEHAVTRAQAFLADAEANEEQAVKAAMNAEADAEVAEGMAFAAVDHIALQAAPSELQNSSEASTLSTPLPEQTPENNDEEDITTKISVMRPQEQS